MVMRQRANDNTSYEEANLKKCIFNGKNPNTYKGIHNYDAEMISVYTRLNFGCICSFASHPASTSTTPVTSPEESDDQPEIDKDDTVATYAIEGRKVLHISPPSAGASYYSPHQSKELLEKMKLSMDSMQRVLQ